MLGKEHTYMSDEPSGFSTSVSCSCLRYQHDMQELLNNTSNKQEEVTINGAKYSLPLFMVLYRHDMKELLNNTSNKKEKETINGAKYSPPPMNHL